MSEQEMITGAQAGNEAAFAAMYNTYHQRVFNQLVKIVKNAEDAEDLTQEVFLKAHTNIHQFREECQLSTWLYKIALNVGRMHLRSTKVRPHGHASSIEEMFPERMEEDQAGSGNTGDLRLSTTPDHITSIDIQKALRCLSPGYRTVVLMHGIAGLQAKETAALLGRSVGNVKSQMFKARETLKRILG